MIVSKSLVKAPTRPGITLLSGSARLKFHSLRDGQSLSVAISFSKDAKKAQFLAARSVENMV